MVLNKRSLSNQEHTGQSDIIQSKMASLVLSPPVTIERNEQFSLTGVKNTAHNNCPITQGHNWSNDRFQINNIGTDRDDCGVNLLLIQSFRNLLKLYSMHVNDRSCMEAGLVGEVVGPGSPLIVAGGLQQYLIKNMKKAQGSSQQPRRGAGSEYTTFHDLPDSIHLKIFSYLNIRDLCQASRVCCHWYCVASDNVHWQKRLQEDVKHWDVISHTTYPQMYQECQSDWTNKEIYLRCSPEVNRMLKQTYLNFPLTSILRTLWPKKTPRVAMFGPGLETGTSRIARKILEDKSGMFKTTGMFPGQFEGMGSGFTMKMSRVNFHLVTLYSSTRQEREARPRNERLQHSRLLNQAAANPGNADEESAETTDSDEEEEEYEVRKAVKDLCGTLDAFIFVIDASQNEASVKSARAELRAMVNDKWVATSAPVVVASCIPDTKTSRVPCNEVVRILRMPKYSRPWQVRDCDVDTMEGVTDAIEWVVEQAHRSS